MDKEKIIHQLEARLLKICPDVITRPTVVGREGATKESEWSRQIVVPGRYSMDEYLKTVFGISNPDWGKPLRVQGKRQIESQHCILPHFSRSYAFQTLLKRPHCISMELNIRKFGLR